MQLSLVSLCLHFSENCSISWKLCHLSSHYFHSSYRNMLKSNKTNKDVCGIPLIAFLYCSLFYFFLPIPLFYLSTCFVCYTRYVSLKAFGDRSYQMVSELQVDCVNLVSLSVCIQLKKHQQISEAWLPFIDTVFFFSLPQADCMGILSSLKLKKPGSIAS